ncbi:ABC transporter ATP-binding protein [Roseicella frigidaeris]|uniref:ABC transporter ATP-binding protein n=1 Tax=Roseicella frigidaeris TaxID=2230885 RepID=A0A327M0R2_9PROT|nr:ATP-binding cassette domain-containing protein [Roseicella frigidaeris]RAI56007.1 ABC transporter ATP-binding protein [Roseicella frigidaeris]
MSGHVRLRDLTVQAADGTPLVAGLSLAAGPGTPLVLLGETGSGKSLVLQAIMGALPPHLRRTGEVVLDGQPLPEGRARRGLWGRRIALLPQEPWLALDPTMRALAQVAEVYRLVRGMPAPRSRAEAEQRLRDLGIEEAARLYPFQLSGGMAQRLALAVLRATDAPLLLADEPTKGLDAARRDEAALRLRDEAGRGRTVIAVTHDIGVARILGGHLAVMLEGRILEQGPSERLLRDPAQDYTRRLIAAEPSQWPTQWRAPSIAPPRPAGEAVVEGRRLGKRFQDRAVLREVDIAVGRGEVVAVLGPSGCGKTTLGDLLLGLLPPSQGEVRRAAGLAPWRFQKLYQDPPSAFAPHQSMRDALRHLGRRHGLAPTLFEGLRDRLRLPPALLDRRPAELSGGELQRFALLRALALDPVFLFADEPTSRLDPITQQEVALLLRGLVSERNLGLLLVTHDAMLAQRMADRVFTIEAARLLPAGRAG